MLKTVSLSAYYGKIRALTNVSLHVKKGEFVSLIGSNGAGKTTLLNSIMGHISNKTGKIYFDEKEITNFNTEKIVSLGIGYVPEGRRIFTDMTVEENLEMGAFLIKNKSKIKENIKQIYEIFPVLKERKKQIAGMLSGGEQQMLAIGRALMLSPNILLMDEPSMGLAPKIITDLYNKLKVLKKSGITIFLVEQNAKIALKYSDRSYVLENGSIILQGKSSELLNDNELLRAYLGKEYKDKWER
ncbi:branched-chain amino acid ABC transporter, ATP-binding protein [Deferribacter desulfuricans SSM1]|uniref:Branched-chain amino acid ABC transporter, ATP-binding protein n=1 Tax=Deferribacter desulfuricans (strain DSM 14783 / JCM 11476 / NBRC 101012 / SSM1) TaxID=639282 RepID=D3PCV7_DEFDS|nr:ABC transporter ATP-binding protein [Deferribacter desulfuricans]BAI80430.1 branched-chain amino acid ABC transporter, ATP-binding protein [Deferribacter desulfuricans SSM1]